MKIDHTTNSIAGVEAFLLTLHPEKEVAVFKDHQYYYVEDPGPRLLPGQNMIYEGKAIDFTV